MLLGRLLARPYSRRDPRSIPPREWLYGHAYLRGALSVLVAPGGAGKSTLAWRKPSHGHLRPLPANNPMVKSPCGSGTGTARTREGDRAPDRGNLPAHDESAQRTSVIAYLLAT